MEEMELTKEEEAIKQEILGLMDERSLLYEGRMEELFSEAFDLFIFKIRRLKS